MRRNKNDFFLEVSCVKNYHFFPAPRWSEKALFCTIFFSPNIDCDHKSVHLGWFIWVFWECMVRKNDKFPSTMTYWGILEFKLFWILNFLVWITPMAIWECISWLPGFIGKMRRNKNDFFWRCHVWKITIFSQPRGGQKRHFFAQFFFLRI